MDWTSEDRSGVRVLTGSERGEEHVRLYARPRFGPPGEGIEGWTIARYEVTEAVRGAAAHRALTAALIDKAKDEGWVTDDDIVAHELIRDDDGKVKEMRAGSLVVKYPDDPTEIMGFRASAREKAEEVAAAKHVELEPIDDATAEVLGRGKDDEAKDDHGRPDPDIDIPHPGRK